MLKKRKRAEANASGRQVENKIKVKGGSEASQSINMNEWSCSHRRRPKGPPF